MRLLKALLCFLPLIGSLKPAGSHDQCREKEEVKDSILSLRELFTRMTQKEFEEYEKDLNQMTQKELSCQYQICSLLEVDLIGTDAQIVTRKVKALLIELIEREHNLFAYIDQWFGSILRFCGCGFAFDQAFNDLFLECVKSDKFMSVEELRTKIGAIPQSKSFDPEKTEIMLQFASDLTDADKILAVCTDIRQFMLEEMTYFKGLIAQKLQQKYNALPETASPVNRTLAYAYMKRTANRWISHVEGLLPQFGVKGYRSENLRKFINDMTEQHPWHASFLLQSSYHLLEVCKIGEPECLNVHLVRVARTELQSISGAKMYYFLEAIPWFKATATLLCRHGYEIIKELFPSWTALILPENSVSIAEFFGNMNEKTICEMNELFNQAGNAYVAALEKLGNELESKAK